MQATAVNPVHVDDPPGDGFSCIAEEKGGRPAHQVTADKPDEDRGDEEEEDLHHPDHFGLRRQEFFYAPVDASHPGRRHAGADQAADQGVRRQRGEAVTPGRKVPEGCAQDGGQSLRERSGRLGLWFAAVAVRTSI